MASIRNCYAVGDGPLRTWQSPLTYLFNQNNLKDFETSIVKGLKLILDTVESVEKPFSGILPHELAIDFKDLNLERPLASVDDALREIDQLYLRDAIYFHHPKYLAHLNCPIVYPAILAELILSSINSSMDTWDQSAGGTLIEQKLIDWTAKRIGYDQKADGIFTSGGTQSNLMGLLLARDRFVQKRYPQHCNKTQGLPPNAGLFRIFTSEISHFSVQKSAAILGLGYRAIIPVACDEKFKMDPQALEQEIQKTLQAGLIPIAVVATAGTTDFGSIDPLHEIAEICQTYGLWMHGDAAYGCGLLNSNRHGDLISGLSKADSITVDYHKSFFQPVSCGAFFCKDKSQLSHITYYAEYLNPLSQQQEGTPNLVSKSLQTTRRFDALKLWLTLRIMGVQKLGTMFDQVISLTKEAYELFVADSSIEVLHRPEISTLVFRFVPENHEEYDIPAQDIDKANESIRKAILRSGSGIIAGTKVFGRSYLKLTLLNPMTRISDLAEVLELIKFHGNQFLELTVMPNPISKPLDSHEEFHERYYL